MKRKIILSTIIILIIILSLILIYSKKEEPILKNQNAKKNNFLSIMIEEQAGTGKYNKEDEFPQIGYVLNSKLSKCLNGSKIKYENGSIFVIGNKADRCYVYFDYDALGSLCRNQNMAKCFIKNYKKDGSIIYHDGLPDYEGMANANLEANDLSYRYSGGNDEVNNYVCFGGDCSNNPSDPDYANLYRIIGFFKNEEDNYEVKIIKADYATETELGGVGNGSYVRVGNVSNGNSDYLGNNDYYTKIGSYFWNNDTNNNNWKESNLNKVNLNNYFLNTYLGKGVTTIDNPNLWQNMIQHHIWYTGGNTQANIQDSKTKQIYESEIGNNKLNVGDNCPNNSICKLEDLQYDGFVGLLYASDYAYAASSSAWNEQSIGYYHLVKNKNWLYMGLSEWLLTRNTNSPNSFIYAYFIAYSGAVYYNLVYGSYDGGWGRNAIRPVLYLKPDVKLVSGNGSKENPFKLQLN